MPRLNPPDENYGNLTGPQREAFQNLLINAFDPASLDRMLANKLERDRPRITLAGSYEGIVFEVISDAERKSWTADLLAGALAERPADIGLVQFAQQFDMIPSAPAAERVIREKLGYKDAKVWLPTFMQRLVQVCRVEIYATDIRGTGFLVAPDVVLTNHHVVAEVIKGEYKPRLLRFAFDHYGLTKDAPLNKGVVSKAHASEWLIAAANGVDAPFETASATQLDFALIRLADAPGKMVVDQAANLERGWFQIPMGNLTFPRGEPLLILGHPHGGDLMISLDTDAVQTENATKTRIRYTTNTDPGSSGSPCMDLDWNLCALHHAGDPKQPPAYNQGIPIDAIRRYLESQLDGDDLEAWQANAINQLLYPNHS